MKNRFSLLISAVLLLTILTGCEHFVPDGDGSDRPDIEPTEAPTDGTKPTPEKDPTVDEYGFTIFPEGNYLADPKFDTDDFLPDYDVEPSMFQYLSTVDCTVCSTEDSIFSFTYNLFKDPPNNILLYTDKTTGLTMPLCGKPECTHDNSSCSAWVGETASGLRIYDGKIVWVNEGSMEVKRMNQDGTDRETVTRLGWSRSRDFGNYADFFIHRGYVYSVGTKELVVDGEPSFAHRIYAQPLDGGEAFVILDKVMPGGSRNAPFCWAVPAGNDLIIMTIWWVPDIEDDGLGDKHTEIYRWSSKTRKVEQLYSAVNSPWNIEPVYGGYPQVIPGDGIYFISYNVLPSKTLEGGENPGKISEYRLIRLSFDTKEFEELSSFQLENGGSSTLTQDRIYILGPQGSEDKRLMAYDYDGNLTFRSEPLGEILQFYFDRSGEDGDYFYLYTTDAPGPEFFVAVSLKTGEHITIR